MRLTLQDLEHPEYSNGARVRVNEQAIEINSFSAAIRKNVGAIVFNNNTENDIVLTFNKKEDVESLIILLMHVKGQMSEKGELK